MASTDKMKCALCNERNGKTRCEGCNTLFCLPCMNKHHDELGQQFELLMDVRNEVKQSLENCRSTSSNGKQMPCLVEIDEWERKIIQRIQQAAANARTNVNELIIKHMNEVSDRFEQISIHMQQQQKERDYLESDIEKIKNQLDDLKNDIKHMSGKIQIDSSISNNIEWDTLIYVLGEELPSKAISESVQSDAKITKKNNKLGLISRFSKAEKSNDASQTIFPTQQSAAQAPEPSSIPVHFVQSNSLSNNSNEPQYLHNSLYNNDAYLEIQKLQAIEDERKRERRRELEEYISQHTSYDTYGRSIIKQDTSPTRSPRSNYTMNDVQSRHQTNYSNEPQYLHNSPYNNDTYLPRTSGINFENSPIQSQRLPDYTKKTLRDPSVDDTRLESYKELYPRNITDNINNPNNSGKMIHSDRSHSPVLLQIPKTRARRLFECSYCGYLNESHNLKSNSEFRCAACNHPIPLD